MEIYRELELEVEYDYQPEEKMVRYYKDGTGHPGCAANVMIYAVKLGNKDITECFTVDEISSMEQEILEQL